MSLKFKPASPEELAARGVLPAPPAEPAHVVAVVDEAPAVKKPVVRKAAKKPAA